MQLERDRLTAIMDSMKDGVYIVNQECDIEYANPSLLEEFGPVNGRKCHQYLNDRDQVCSWCRNQEVFSGKTVHWEWRFEKNGKTYDLLDTPLRNSDGSLSKLEIFRDITERKEMEKQLRESEEQYRTLFEEAPNAYLSVGTDGLIKQVNIRVTELLGYEASELIGKPVSDLYADTLYGKPKAKAIFEKFIMGESIDDEELEMRRADGSRIWISLTVRPIIDSKGQVMASRSSVTDITERKKAEERIAFQSELLRAIEDVILATDTEGNITYWGIGANNLLGWQAEEVMGRSAVDILFPKESRREAKALGRLLRSGQSWSGEITVGRKDGILIPLLIHSSPVLGNNDEVVSVVVVGKEITELKKIERIKDEFIGLVSHELRTPLTVITGCLNTIMTESSQLSPSETQQLLHDALLETGSLSHLVSNLLELSRVQAGQLILYTEPVRFDKIIAKVEERINVQYPTHSIIIDLPSDLQSINADPIRIERIIYNLMENAAKYSASGSEIRLYGNLEPKQLVIGVSDQGPGIPSNEQEKLFKPFQRLEQSVLNGVKGAGLGLLVCRRLVEAHGGHIWVESKSNLGSTFLFTIPLNS